MHMHEFYCSSSSTPKDPVLLQFLPGCGVRRNARTACHCADKLRSGACCTLGSSGDTIDWTSGDAWVFFGINTHKGPVLQDCSPGCGTTRYFSSSSSVIRPSSHCVLGSSCFVCACAEVDILMLKILCFILNIFINFCLNKKFYPFFCGQSKIAPLSQSLIIEFYNYYT